MPRPVKYTEERKNTSVTISVELLKEVRRRSDINMSEILDKALRNALEVPIPKQNKKINKFKKLPKKEENELRGILISQPNDEAQKIAAVWANNILPKFGILTNPQELYDYIINYGLNMGELQ